MVIKRNFTVAKLSKQTLEKIFKIDAQLDSEDNLLT
jgi:hypothetical protein